MIIPWAKIVWIDDFKGYGLVATQLIPKGTISFVQDGLDVVLTEAQLTKLPVNLVQYVEKYSYEDFLGNRIISWDLGKYMNHDDSANTLSTGYGFEIVVRDIQPGEEITDDYRIFSTHHDTSFKKPYLSLEDIKPWSSELLDQWDTQVFSALAEIQNVKQPLQEFVDADIWQNVEKFLNDKNAYQSVAEALPLRYKLQTERL